MWLKLINLTAVRGTLNLYGLIAGGEYYQDCHGIPQEDHGMHYVGREQSELSFGKAIE